MYVSVLILIVATVSFSQSTFIVAENAKVVTIDLVRSGDTSSEVVVLIGSHPYKGSATGMCNRIIMLNRNICNNSSASFSNSHLN